MLSIAIMLFELLAFYVGQIGGFEGAEGPQTALITSCLIVDGSTLWQMAELLAYPS